MEPHGSLENGRYLNSVHTVDGTNPAPVNRYPGIPVSHYLPGFIHSRWCRISSINSMDPRFWLDQKWKTPLIKMQQDGMFIVGSCHDEINRIILIVICLQYMLARIIDWSFFCKQHAEKTNQHQQRDPCKAVGGGGTCPCFPIWAIFKAQGMEPSVAQGKWKGKELTNN